MKTRISFKAFIRFIALAGLAGSFLPAPAVAEDLEYSLTPYLWAAGLDGTVDAFANLPPATVDLSFSDLLGNINAAAMVKGEAWRGQYGLSFDLSFVDIEQEATLRGIVYDTASLRTKIWLVTVAGEYRLSQSEQGYLDFIGGIRYSSWESIIKLTGTQAGFSRSGKDDWFDPVIGLQFMRDLGDANWYADGALLLGGFGVGADLIWDASLNLGYRWSQTFSTTLGYRYNDIDYEDDGFVVDVAVTGFVLGLNWAW